MTESGRFGRLQAVGWAAAFVLILVLVAGYFLAGEAASRPLLLGALPGGVWPS